MYICLSRVEAFPSSEACFWVCTPLSWTVLLVRRELCSSEAVGAFDEET